MEKMRIVYFVRKYRDVSRIIQVLLKEGRAEVQKVSCGADGFF